MKKFAYLFLVFTTVFSVFAATFATRQVSAQSSKSETPDAAPSEKLNRARDISYGYLAQIAPAKGIRDVSDLKLKRLAEDKEGFKHTRVKQTHKGVPVFGGEAIVHLSPDDSLFAVTDDLIPSVQVDTNPKLDNVAAIGKATAAFGCADCLTAPPTAALNILRHNGRDHLTFRVELRREDGSQQTSLPVYFIDAKTGEVVWSYDNLQTASGSSLYSGTVTIGSYLNSGTYYMEDLSRKIGTFDSRNTTASVYRFTDADNVWNSTTQRAGVDAQYGAAIFYDYYNATHGRRGIDGNGGPAYYTSADGVTGLISSKVHYGSSYNNAFWNGSFMTYGDGDGTTFSPLVTLDICGHEMQHGVTERTANLVYSNESGALNESWSDVFGALTERYARGETSNTWQIGEQSYTPATAGDALRSMSNPHAARNSGYTADDDPDHYAERYTGTGDNGGVHVNSGIPNKVFYLLAVGGTHHRGGSMTGIGASAASRIWYRALTSYMTSSTNFAGGRAATLNAAAALYGSGSTNYNAVARAWTLCGIG